MVLKDWIATSSMDASGSRVVRACRARFGLIRKRKIGETQGLAVQRIYSTEIPASTGINKTRLASLQNKERGPSAVKTRIEISTNVRMNAVTQRGCSKETF